MFLSADMLCLVQSFQQNKLPKPPSSSNKEKSSKPRKLPFLRRKKLPSASCASVQGEKLLRPESSASTRAFWRQDKQGKCKTTGTMACSKFGNILVQKCPKHVKHSQKRNDTWRHTRQGLKHLSGSAPSVACALPPSSSQPSPLTPTTSSSRQKKFLRHFNVHPDEKVIDYFSCALVADILLQGHLYISRNYFAFYSNVFGYVTKLLIPISSVVTVTKEKTAFILPNAVAVTTAEDRHVFSSLLSRDTTYRLMVQVWREELARNIADTSTDLKEIDAEGSLCHEPLSLSRSEPNLDTSTASARVPTVEQVEQPSSEKGVESSLPRRLPHSTMLLAVSTVLLVVLFISAAVLLYRVSLLHHNLQLSTSSRSLYEVQEFLDINLQNLYKVRQSLEVLSLLMETEREDPKETETAERENELTNPPPGNIKTTQSTEGHNS